MRAPRLPWRCRSRRCASPWPSKPTRTPTFIPRLIELLAYKPLAEIVATPFVASQIPPLLERHQRSIEIIRKHSECTGQTIFFDVTGYDLEGYNKFIPYYLHPESVYSVGLEQEQLPGEDLGGFQPLDRRGEHDQPGQDLRALRRRRPCAGGSHQLSSGRFPARHPGRA